MTRGSFATEKEVPLRLLPSHRSLETGVSAPLMFTFQKEGSPSLRIKFTKDLPIFWRIYIHFKREEKVLTSFLKQMLWEKGRRTLFSWFQQGELSLVFLIYFSPYTCPNENRWSVEKWIISTEFRVTKIIDDLKEDCDWAVLRAEARGSELEMTVGEVIESVV